AGVTLPRRRVSVRTSRAPKRLMMISRPRCGCLTPGPATSTKHSPSSGSACSATCPPWHRSAAARPRGPTCTTGAEAGLRPAAFAGARRRADRRGLAEPDGGFGRAQGIDRIGARSEDRVGQRDLHDLLRRATPWVNAAEAERELPVAAGVVHPPDPASHVRDGRAED